MDEEKSKWSYLPLILGILAVIIGIAFAFLGEYKDAYAQSITGLTFIVMALLFKQTIKWNEMPKGMKVLIVYFWFAYFLNIFNLYRQFEETIFFIGFPIQFPLALLFKPISLVIIIVSLLGIYRRTWWKAILAVNGLGIINSLAASLWMILTPLQELYSVMGREVPATITPELAFTAKLSIVALSLVSLIIPIIIWTYVFVKKDYFEG